MLILDFGVNQGEEQYLSCLPGLSGRGASGPLLPGRIQAEVTAKVLLVLLFVSFKLVARLFLENQSCGQGIVCLNCLLTANKRRELDNDTG